MLRYTLAKKGKELKKEKSHKVYKMRNYLKVKLCFQPSTDFIVYTHVKKRPGAMFKHAYRALPRFFFFWAQRFFHF